MKTENIVDVYPMNDVQKGMVFTTLKNTGDVIYHDQFVYYVPAVKDPARFEKAIRLMMEVHPILRTGFDLENYTAQLQIVYGKVDPIFSFEDISHLSEDEQEKYIKRYMLDERYKPYDFKIAPLWRITVFNLDSHSGVYLIQFHHAVLDGWSMATFNTQLFNIYYELEKDPGYTPEPLKASVKDAVAEEIAEKNNQSTIQFWKNKLSYYNKPAIFTTKATFQEIREDLSPEATKKLKDKSAADKLSYKNVLYGAFVYVLKTISLEEDFVVGIVSNTRPVMEDGDKVLGCFLNSLPMKLSFGEYEHMTWLEYFKSIEEEMRILKTKDRSTLFEISKIAGEQIGAENPFFDILFNHIDFYNVYKDLNVATGETQYLRKQKNIKLRSFEVTNTFLDANIIDTFEGAIQFHFKMSRELQPGYSLEQIHRYIMRILSVYLESPDTKIRDTRLLSEEELGLLNAFNATRKPYADQTTVLDLLNETVEQHGQMAAVSYKEKTLTYRELNEQAGRLANYLRSQYDVQPNDLVGIKLERSERMILSILGILKSGGAYVPIDTNYPEERIAYIKADSNCKVCIDEEFLEAFDKEKNNFKTSVEGINISGNNTAYAIYTSGSTGNPKGVLNEHAGLYNRLLWMRDDLGINASDVILQKTPYTFDVSVWELLMPSITGCKLVFAEPEGHKDPAYLQNVIQSAGVTIIHFVPSMLGIFLEELEAGKCKSLRHVVCSGEALPAVMVEEFKQKLPWVRIHNLYGPTEAGIDVTSVDLTEVDTKEHGVTIGKPVANTKIFIVDKYMSLQPVGVPGELLIEGVQVARGYLNRPELTAEKFIESPFNKGERIYRTGDLAKWLPNGEIAYIGRIDNQVKIRGNRIELGEIETRIIESGLVEQAAVLVMADDASRKYLVAYIIPKPEYSEDLLFNYLQAQLPEYMLPSRVMEMKEFPLTGSGKLNRKALPAPNDEAIAHSAYEAPRNETETALAGIWRDVLGLNEPGIHDNFFRIGGDSILSIRLISRINKHFNVSLTISGLYNYNSIARLSDFITNGSGISAEEEMLRKRIITSVDQLKEIVLKDAAGEEHIEDVYPMRDIQKGMIVLSSINPVAGMYHDQFVFQAPRVDVGLFNRAFAKLVKKHEALRTCFDLTTHREEIQIVKKNVRFNIVETDLQALSKEQQEKFISDFMAKDRREPFDPRVAPLWRLNLFATSPGVGVLLFQFHHAILDGWSVASLYTELFQIYNQLEKDPGFQPAALKSSNKQAAIEELVEKNRQPNIEFWKNDLAGTQRLNIFTKNQVYKLYTKNYDSSFKQQLVKKCAEDKVSLKSVVYGAFVYIMKVLSNENDFVIGSVSNNRPVTEDGDKILGCFLNTTPVSNKLADIDNMTWSRYFKKTEEKFNSLKGMERNTLYQIVKIVNEGNSDNSPFFDILYNYTDFHIYNTLSFNREDTSGDKKSRRLTIDNYESTNTALDLGINVTGDRLSFAYTLLRELKMDISLEKIHECVDQVLTTYINNPDTKTKEMELVTEGEKQKLLYNFNDTRKDYPGDVTMIDLFRDQVAKTPDHTAATFEGQGLSYKELDMQSGQLAHFLISQGLTKGEIVPVYMSRSLEMIVSIFAILKAGGAYLPIDEGNPADRINYILDDSGARFVLTTSSFTHLFGSGKVTPVFIDTVNYQDFPAVETGIDAGVHDMVYIIYTSGSTGRPKGVMVSHGALAARLRFYKHYYNLGEQDRILFYSSFGFDGSVEEYILPFTTGAQCVIAGPSFKNDLFTNMVDFIESFKITKIFMPPVVLQNFIEALPNDQVHRVKSLRRVVAGGDKLNAEVANNFYDKIGRETGGSLYNAYGPTENTNDSAIFRIDGYSTEKNIPIGKPVENSGMYILDSHGRLLPVGLTGEICVSGSGLAMGYLNRPELTAEKFVPHPYKQGERMYRTGDTGFWLEDGNVVFTGRVDNQAKIRGYRIEPGEIETIMMQSGFVENAAVLIKEKEAEARKYLVAYVVPAEGYQQANLYSYLKEQLPDYMVPGMIIEMESFPVNINGKLDVKALPEPDERFELTNEYVAPTNETEEKLVAVWQQVLGLNRIGIKDNFFHIGGDSLIILKLRHKIIEVLNIEVNVVDLFNYTTIQDFTSFISRNMKNEGKAGQDTLLETLKF